MLSYRQDTLSSLVVVAGPEAAQSLHFKEAASLDLVRTLDVRQLGQLAARCLLCWQWNVVQVQLQGTWIIVIIQFHA